MIRAANLDDTLDFFVDKLGLVEAYRYDNDAGRFTLVFLSAPDDLEGAKSRQAPLGRDHLQLGLRDLRQAGATLGTSLIRSTTSMRHANSSWIKA
jgi:catechol 2,3-dioxygenase-like lactoylglutathione lyase family enzyme